MKGLLIEEVVAVELTIADQWDLQTEYVWDSYGNCFNWIDDGHSFIPGTNWCDDVIVKPCIKRKKSLVSKIKKVLFTKLF